MTQETMLRVFKKVSLIDISECEFEYGDGLSADSNGWKSIEEGLWINAMVGGKVVDAIKWDGNIFWMMNNDGSMSPLNPMMPAFIEAGLLPQPEHQQVVAVLNWLSGYKEKSNTVEGGDTIVMIAGNYYWAGDDDGDCPMDGNDIVQLYLSNKAKHR